MLAAILLSLCCSRRFLRAAPLVVDETEGGGDPPTACVLVFCEARSEDVLDRFELIVGIDCVVDREFRSDDTEDRRFLDFSSEMR